MNIRLRAGRHRRPRDRAHGQQEAAEVERKRMRSPCLLRTRTANAAGRRFEKEATSSGMRRPVGELTDL